DRDRAGDVPVDKPERPDEEVDARRDDRRTDSVVVEHERLDQIVDMTSVVRGVDDAPRLGCGFRDVNVLADAFDLAEDRIERVLEGAVNRVALPRAQLLEIRFDA